MTTHSVSLLDLEIDTYYKTGTFTLGTYTRSTSHHFFFVTKTLDMWQIKLCGYNVYTKFTK